MAALNGVKTLDMVGGEITKVEYNGAEYVRVDDAKIGDIVLNEKKHEDLTHGAYYRVSRAYSSGIASVRVNDDVHDSHDLLRRDFKVLFRKVSAETTPTVDERVDALEKRVDALEEKPVEPKLKTGDYVKFAEDNDYVTTEKHYEVFENPADGGYMYKHYVIDEDGEDNAIVLDNAYEIVEPTPFTRAGRKEGEFKAGDVVKSGGSYYAKHDDKIGMVEDVARTMVGIRYPDGRYCGATSAKCELIAPVESRVDGSERPCA